MKGSETIDGGALARRLGWFSLGLGVAHLIAGRQVGRVMGIERRSGLLRAYGLREIAMGAGILSRGAPAPWIWGRLAGDAMDIATLAPALARGNPGRGRAGLALGAVAAVTAVDALCARSLAIGHRHRPMARDYGDRSGFPRPPEQMRGAARTTRPSL